MDRNPRRVGMELIEELEQDIKELEKELEDMEKRLLTLNLRTKTAFLAAYPHSEEQPLHALQAWLQYTVKQGWED